ncbi:MAG TPA: cytochrome C oxidase subunit IV family protein [Vicinamibacteria bacterium]|jgi:cytochrome c oxidase subunit 4
MSTHAESAGSHGYKGYLIIWVVLLVLTVTMIFISESKLAAAPHTILLLLGSAVKASLIIFFYMHLRLENRNLILLVLIGIFLTSVLMFAVPAFDGTQILLHRYFK